MKKIPELIISALIIGIIVYVFQFSASRDRLATEGREIFLELAPVDPLSLLQGQYMRVEFAVEREWLPLPQEINYEGKRAVLKIDERGIATFVGVEANNDLGPDQVLFRGHLRKMEDWERRREQRSDPVQRGPFKLGKELLVNGSFEKLSGDFATGWTGRSFRGAAQHRLANVARTGKHSIEISADKASEWGVTMNVPIDMNSEYELSAWVKTENVGGGGRGALLYVSAHPDQPGSNGVKGTQDWTQIKLRFNSGSQKVASINCLFGGWGVSTGKAWWDDVSLRKVEYETITGDESEVTKGDVERDEPLSEHYVKLEIPQRTFLFKENTEDRYESAKYGAFRVGEGGDHILMDLADENLQKLTIIKE